LRKGLDDFEDLENVSEMVAETSESSRDHQSESATSEQHVHVHMCYQCKQHMHVHVQNLQFVISAEKTTFQREKGFAML